MHALVLKLQCVLNLTANVLDDRAAIQHTPTLVAKEAKRRKREGDRDRKEHLYFKWDCLHPTRGGGGKFGCISTLNLE
jgi:hypothetical protein